MSKKMFFSPVGSGYDPDAQAYFTASGLTDTSKKDAVNSFYLYCKANGIYTLLDAFYLCVGGNSSAHSYNGKNPLIHQLTYSGGLTHSVNGIKPNGTNGYANTNFNTNTLNILDSHFSYYSRENIKNDAFIGFGEAGLNSMNLYLRGAFYNEKIHAVIGQSNGTTSLDNIVANNTNSSGFFLVNRIGTSTKIYRNNSILGSKTSTVSGTFSSSRNLFLGARNLGNAPNSYDTREFCFSSVGRGLNDTQEALLYTGVQNLQTALGRQV
jgi:hypothetical protein